jgi:hypothetical protein
MMDFCHIYTAIKNLESYFSGLGTMALQNADAVAITGGTVAAKYLVTPIITSSSTVVPLKINAVSIDNDNITLTFPTASASLVGSQAIISFQISGTGKISFSNILNPFSYPPDGQIITPPIAGTFTFYCIPTADGFAWTN